MRKLDLNNRKNYMRYIDYLNKVNHCKRETKVLVDFEKNGEFTFILVISR